MTVDMTMRCRRTKRLRPEDGAGLVEYMLLVALIAVVCVTSIAYLGNSVDGRFGTIGSRMEATTPGP